MSLLSLSLHPVDTIETALRVIDANAGKIVLIVDGNAHLLGTVSDGDIRRALLRGRTLTDPVDAVMNRHPTTISSETDRSEALQLMREMSLRHLPVVDKERRVIALRSLEELVSPAPRENWVVILAGGEGQRLRPLTADCPKPMLPMGERPLLEQTILGLKGMGFHRFYLAVNYMAKTIITYFGDGEALGVDIRYLHEDSPLGTAGPLGLLPEASTLPMLVMNGDILTRLDFPAMMDFHQEHEALATMGVREFEIQIPYGVVDVEDIRITSIEEKPRRRHLISAGIYVLSPEVIALVPRGQYLEMPALFLEAQRHNANVLAYLIREYWIDIGHLDDLNRARRDFRQIFPPKNGGKP